MPVPARCASAPWSTTRTICLTPGIFARVQLFGGEFDALLIPDTAVVSDQARKIVFMVGADNVVGVEPVTLGQIVDGLRVRA